MSGERGHRETHEGSASDCGQRSSSPKQENGSDDGREHRGRQRLQERKERQAEGHQKNVQKIVVWILIPNLVLPGEWQRLQCAGQQHPQT